MNLSNLNPSPAVRKLNPALFGVTPVPQQTVAAERVGALPDPGAERDLQRACEHELHRRGVWYLHLSTRAREKCGCPDLLFPHPATGQFCAVELKAKTGRPSDAQKRALADIERNGGRVAVVRSYGEFMALLENAKSEALT